MKWKFGEKGFHELFEISIITKGIVGFFEFIAGIFLSFINPFTINRFVAFLIQKELSEDPKDIMANFLFHTTQNISPSSKHYLAFFLIAHGIIKIILVIGLLRNKLWAYSTSIILFLIFIISQIYHLSHSYSLFWGLAILFDIAVVILIFHEYKHAKQQQIILNK